MQGGTLIGVRATLRAVGLIALIAGCGTDRRTIEVVTAGGAGPAAVEPPALVAGERSALVAARDDAHRVMSVRCGECHESHRATAVPRALAIFDLDQPDWPARFDDHRFAAGLVRFGSAPEPDRQAFVAFRDAELAARRP